MKWLLIAMCVLAGCHQAGALPESHIERVDDKPFGIAQWEYINRDSDGQPIAKGTLTLPSPLPISANFYGTWQARYLGKIGEENKIGPQINGGKLLGQFSADGILTLQLNPNHPDSNVILKGKIASSTIRGTWEFDTAAGPMKTGAFEASPAN